LGHFGPLQKNREKISENIPIWNGAVASMSGETSGQSGAIVAHPEDIFFQIFCKRPKNFLSG
jgi:hypothetical protein